MMERAWKMIGEQLAPSSAVIDWLPLPQEETQIGGPLRGVPFAVKNNICVAGAKLTCGSRLLENYISPYSATAVEMLRSFGAVAVCTANLDEFGMGSTGENSAFGVPENPAAPGSCPGGSSSGSAALVASGCVPLALASDTGGSARLPAAYCGVFGMKPTYGAFSRYGLTSYASSLEQIGLIASEVPLLRIAHTCLSARQDPRDATHRGLPQKNAPFFFRGKKIVLIEEWLPLADTAIALAISQAADCFERAGARIVTRALPQARLLAAAYYVIACAEASANLARFTGLIAGKRMDGEDWEERFAKSRALLGSEVQKRIALGAYVLGKGHYDQYYLRAQAYRRRLTAWFQQLFSDCALVLLPVSFHTAPPRGVPLLDPLAPYQADALTACANLAGLPALSLPWGRDEQGKPVAVQLLAPWNRDGWLFDAATHLLGDGEEKKA